MTEERSEALAAELRRRGVDAPALLLLEAHRPLRPLLASLATFISPLTRPLLGRGAETILAALDDDDAYERLIHQLEPEVDG